jgi:hypothetical protein
MVFLLELAIERNFVEPDGSGYKSVDDARPTLRSRLEIEAGINFFFCKLRYDFVQASE